MSKKQWCCSININGMFDHSINITFYKHTEAANCQGSYSGTAELNYSFPPQPAIFSQPFFSRLPWQNFGQSPAHFHGYSPPSPGVGGGVTALFCLYKAKANPGYFPCTDVAKHIYPQPSPRVGGLGGRGYK